MFFEMERGVLLRWAVFIPSLILVIGGNCWVLASSIRAHNKEENVDEIVHIIYKIVTLILITEVGIAALKLVRLG